MKLWYNIRKINFSFTIFLIVETYERINFYKEIKRWKKSR